MQLYLERIQETIDYIEQNLNNDITLDQLAAIAYCSKFHYHRTFQAMVGEPVMEYVRKRRVTLAANEILSTKRKLVDIAYDYGFCSQVDFSRTFRRIQGISPMECRKKIKPVELYDKVSLIGRNFSKEKVSFLNGPVIVEKKGVLVAGMVLKASYEENSKSYIVRQLWRNFRENMALMTGVINKNTAYGISFDGSYRKHFNYMAGVEVDNLDDIPEGMQGREIPGCKYAVFNFKAIKNGFAVIDEFLKALEFIYGQWLPFSGFQLDNKNDLIEIITVNPEILNDVRMDIYLPIK